MRESAASLPWQRSARERVVRTIEDPAERERWLSAAEAAMSLAHTVAQDAYAESGRLGGVGAAATALRFELVPGQRGRVAIAAMPEQLLVEHYRLDGEAWRRVGDVLPLGRAVGIDAPGMHLVLLQPLPGLEPVYTAEVSRGGRALFPVQGARSYDIGGVFGDPRGSGRIHEGIDVFARRGTPVLAAEDGIAMARETPRGGRTVWLRTSAGVSYYYAHLDTVDIEGSAPVRAGEVLGGVGTTGNAQGTPPHLHFGTYRARRGAVDPMPFLAAPPRSDFDPLQAPSFGLAAVDAGALNLRAAPGTASGRVATLERDALLRVVAAAPASWLRVLDAQDRAGFVHGDHVRVVREDECPGCTAAGDDEIVGAG